MSKPIRFELNRQGVRELLNSQDMERVLESYAKGITARAGEGYRSGAYQGSDRVKVNVWPDTPDARRDNIENNTLLKAVGKHD